MAGGGGHDFIVPDTEKRGRDGVHPSVRESEQKGMCSSAEDVRQQQLARQPVRQSEQQIKNHGTAR